MYLAWGSHHLLFMHNHLPVLHLEPHHRRMAVCMPRKCVGCKEGGQTDAIVPEASNLAELFFVGQNLFISPVPCREAMDRHEPLHEVPLLLLGTRNDAGQRCAIFFLIAEARDGMLLHFQNQEGAGRATATCVRHKAKELV